MAITIIESTNTFNQTGETYDSIMTGDLTDSKIIFGSNLYTANPTLKFKVELYFDEELIFETYTPILYSSGTTVISNIDLSRPIRDYLYTQTGLGEYEDDISTKYTEFLKTNNSGQIVITELTGTTVLSANTFDTYIFKAVEKDFQLDIYTGGFSGLTVDNIFLNRYVEYRYNTNNIIDNENNIYTNSIYRSPLLFNFYDNVDDTTVIVSGTTDDGSFRFEILRYVENRNVNQMVEITDTTFGIYPTTNLAWYIYGDVTANGTNFETFKTYYEAANQIDTLIIYPNNSRYYFRYEECNKFTHELRWLNTLGGYDTFNFDLIHQEGLSISDKGYYSNGYSLTDTLYDNPFHNSYKSYDKIYSKKYTFKTNWLTEDQIYLLEDLFKSPEVYYLFNKVGYGNSPEWLSMKNLTKSKTLYHKDIRGLRKYEIVLETALQKEFI